MTDPDSRPAPPPPPDPPRRIPSWALGLILSVLLVGGWFAYLNLAPAPETLAPKIPDAPPAPVAANELRLLTWRNALDEGVLSDFQTETGIKIVSEGFDTNEQLMALADAGHLTQDLILVSGVDLKHLIDRDLLQPMPFASLANGANIDPVIAARAAVYDAGSRFGVVALWGTLGLAFDSAKVSERLGGEAAIDSWSALFDPSTAAKLADCGIQVVDSPRGVFPITLTYLGLPADSAKAEDTEAATRAWETVRPSIAKFGSQDIVDGLAEGRVCLALATSGDAAQARAKSQAAGAAADIRYVLPKEGTIAWYEMMAVPKAAANAANAAKLIDYLLRPQVAARLTNAKGLANAVRDSALYVKPELKADTAVLPEESVAAHFVPELEPSAAAAALRGRFWQLINAPPASQPAPPAASPPVAPALTAPTPAPVPTPVPPQ